MSIALRDVKTGGLKPLDDLAAIATPGVQLVQQTSQILEFVPCNRIADDAAKIAAARAAGVGTCRTIFNELQPRALSTGAKIN